MDRRSFLKALIGLGAAIALPIEPTEQQVAQAWDQLRRHPFLFKVGEFGAIFEPDAPAPRVRSDVYDDIPTAWIRTPGALVRIVDAHPELLSRFIALAAGELEDAQNQLERCDLTADGRAAAARTVALIRQPESDWSDWILAGGLDGLPAFLIEADDWLAEPVDWGATEWWPRDWSGQGKALLFFQAMDDETLDALDVVIVEGDCPGSSYFAAELQQPVAAANAMAEALELPFRFATGRG